MENLTITIVKNDKEHFLYDIYFCSANEVDGHMSEDGGVCTGSIKDALEMATKQAKALLIKTK